MIALPTFQSQFGDFTYRITLGTLRYSLRFLWNPRTQDWWLTIVDPFGGAIDGVRLVANWPLFNNHKAQIQIDGDLILIPKSGNVAPLGYDNLDTDYTLTYLNHDELVQWRAIRGVG